jgi:neutral ceramidase
MSRISAGTGRTEITPPTGVELAGYPHHPRHNTGVHDPLFSTALVIDDGLSSVALVSLDLLFFSKKHVTAVRKSIEQYADIPQRNILIGCTHTHSGPWASGRLDIDSLRSGARQDEAYVKFLQERVVDSVVQAKKGMFDASLGSGAAICGADKGIGGNRRDPAGPHDPTVGIVKVVDSDGACRAIVVNYALHPTVLHADNTEVSADYPGYVRERLNQLYPHALILFLQGASGDQSTRYFRRGQSFAEARRIGYTIADAAFAALQATPTSCEVPVRASSVEVPIRLRELPGREKAQDAVRKAAAEYALLEKSGASYIELQNANLVLLGAEDLLGYVEVFEQAGTLELYEDEREAEVQVLSVGDVTIVALPGELFVEFGAEIKSMHRGRIMMVVSLANGCLPGYVCTPLAHQEGGYEADTSLLAPDFGADLVAAAGHLLDAT